MSPALEFSTSIVAYLALFAAVGLLFLFVNLLVGRFLRPSDPTPEKLEIYECGEPTIGSSFVQFDLRFYVVALLFIIFDVEVAFFFPWAVAYGKASHLMDERSTPQVIAEVDRQPVLTPAAVGLYHEMGVRRPTVVTQPPASLQAQIPAGGAPSDQAEAIVRQGSRQLMLLTLFDIGAFFGVLMVGFAYVWRRGDLDWVRSVGKPGQRAAPRKSVYADEVLDEPALSV